MNLLMIHTGMSFSVFSFFIAYIYRKKDLKLHIIFNSAGVFFNLSSAIYLLLIKYWLGGLEKARIYPNAPAGMIQFHRLVAGITLILMLGMAVTGIKRFRKIHKGLHFIFIPLYLFVYISGLFIFTSKANL